MLIGVNLSHDYAHCVIDGSSVHLLEEERRSRLRYHWDDTSYTLGALDRYPVEFLREAEAVYLSYPRLSMLERRRGDLSSPSRTYTYIGDYPSPDEAGWIGTGKLLVDGLSIPAALVSHYHAHAASAIWASPFPEADILCLDGGGDFGEGAFLYAEGLELSLAQRYLEVQLGSSYHHFAHRVFGVDKGFFESKVMAMAAYGDASLCENSHLSARGRLNAIDSGTRPSVHDIAEFQRRFEDGALELLERAPRQHDSLCCVGGCFYNVLLNLRIAESGLYRRVFVPPHAGDMGTAFGAALLAASQVGNLPSRDACGSAYLGEGCEATDEDLSAIISAAGDVPVFHDIASAYRAFTPSDRSPESSASP